MRTRTLYTPTGRRVELVVDDEIGRGAEGIVLPVADSPHVCAKIYTDPVRATGLGPRLDALTRLDPVNWTGDCPDHLHVAWPRTTLRDDDGTLRGVVVPRIVGIPLLRLLDPRLRIDVLDEPTWRTTFAIAARVGRLFDMLHAAGIVIGDVSPSNVLVDRHGHVTLLDCDGVQFTDPGTGKVHTGDKFTPEYAAPELLRQAGAGVTREHDLFGLGVMLCQLIMEGDHPYEGVSTAQPPSVNVADNIKLQNNRVTHPERLVRTAGSMSGDMLPPRVRGLVRACFEDGFADPARRPSGGVWALELDETGYELMGCRFNPRHAYHPSAPACVWCARAAARQGDHFPPPAGWVPPARTAADDGERLTVPVSQPWNPPYNGSVPGPRARPAAYPAAPDPSGAPQPATPSPAAQPVPQPQPQPVKVVQKASPGMILAIVLLSLAVIILLAAVSSR